MRRPEALSIRALDRRRSMPRFTILLMPFVLVGILETYAATRTPGSWRWVHGDAQSGGFSSDAAWSAALRGRGLHLPFQVLADGGGRHGLVTPLGLIRKYLERTNAAVLWTDAHFVPAPIRPARSP